MYSVVRTVWCALALWMCVATSVRAQSDALDLTQLQTRVSLDLRTEILRDEGLALGIDDVLRRDVSQRFEPSRGVVSRGLDSAALWMRFALQNRASTPRRALVELGYPHHDHVAFYVLYGQGRREETLTGDTLPFGQRPVAVPNFVFPVEVGPGERVDVYVRCATTSTMTVPLTLWEPMAYLEHVRVESVAQWLFCGAIVMMALYNFAVFMLLRRSENLSQSFQLFCICAATLAFRGEMFARFLPNSPKLANNSLSFFLVLCLAACALTCARVAGAIKDHAWLVRPLDRAAVAAGAVCFAMLWVPTHVAVRLSVTTTVCFLVAGGALLAYLTVRPPEEARLFVYSWYFPAAGIAMSLLTNLGYLPDYGLLFNAAYLGGAIQAVLTSLGLAAHVKRMADHLRTLNGELSQNVLRLEHALEDARLANALAQQATRAKDEFLATMSHELRTPLNAIINVPQGLLDDFEEQRTASCGRCESVFVLDPGEVLHGDTACPECTAKGPLRPGQSVAYRGDAARTQRFLRKIERSGQHLLELVNSVLDFSKIEAGRFELNRERADLSTLVREAAEAMGGVAYERHIELAVRLPEGPVLRSLDRVRVRQVLLNLLSNALKFTDDGGRVGVELVADEAHDADLVRITDSGIGIAPEDHERIFLGFEQVHRKKHQRYGGTGLGLPISRNLIRLHGGDLWVESALGSGSRFIVRLPRSSPADATVAPTRPLSTIPRSQPPARAAH